MSAVPTKKRKAVTQVEARSGEEAGPPARQGEIEDGEWWMYARWLKHRNTIEQVHPLLQEAVRTMGSAHLTYATIHKFLDSKDPQFTLLQMQEHRQTPPPAAEGGEDGQG